MVYALYTKMFIFQLVNRIYDIHHSNLHCIPLCQNNILFEKKVFILSVSELLDINIFTTTATCYIHVHTCKQKNLS